jgi:SAM-dependent MidA family methyltransferase
VTEDLLRAPGEQDLTAHANFTALDLWGQRSGLLRTGYVTQLEFLMAMGRGNELADLYEPGASESEKLRARLMLKTLINPEGMGETFRVFVQHKGLDAPRLTGLAGW